MPVFVDGWAAGGILANAGGDLLELARNRSTQMGTTALTIVLADLSHRGDVSQRAGGAIVAFSLCHVHEVRVSRTVGTWYVAGMYRRANVAILAAAALAGACTSEDRSFAEEQSSAQGGAAGSVAASDERGNAEGAGAAAGGGDTSSSGTDTVEPEPMSSPDPVSEDPEETEPSGTAELAPEDTGPDAVSGVDGGQVMSSEGPSESDAGMAEAPVELFPPVIEVFFASEDALPVGEDNEVTLTWSVSGANSVELDFEGDASLVSNGENSARFAVTKSTTFTLIAENDDGVSQSQVGVGVGATGARDWTLQFGSDADEEIFDLAQGVAGSLLVLGFAEGQVVSGGETSFHAFVGEFSAAGRNEGYVALTEGLSQAVAAFAVDSGGDWFIAGDTRSSLVGESAGGTDAWLGRYDSAGDEFWLQQWGTEDDEWARAVAVSGDGIYVAGEREQNNYEMGSVTRFSLDGAREWTYNFAPNSEYDKMNLFKVTVDAEGNAVVVGKNIWIGKPEDGLLAKLSPYGNLIWRRDVGELARSFEELTIDERGDIIVVGHTLGRAQDFNVGDAVVAKFNADGESIWSTTWGAEGGDLANAVAVDGYDNIYVGGWTDGEVGTQPQGEGDATLSKVTTQGTLLWHRQLGSDAADSSRAVMAMGAEVFWLGTTSGEFATASPGGVDGVLVGFQ